ncbi:MAG TPA: iron ABC transporter permease [Thermodesulfobacteriota bacterium]
MRRAFPLAALVIAGVVALPVCLVAANLLVPRGEVWAHLAATLLPELVLNTVLLLVGVGVGVSVLGTGLAWLVATRRFPGRDLFDWALILPLAMPAYVIGFVFVGIFEFSGPVQTALRDLFGAGARLPEIRSYGGVVAVMTLVFYPYVYLLARTAFGEQRLTLLEAARSLGETPRGAFFRVALPLARPAIAAGAALALMEALADFGTVATFGYRTFTTAIYRVWFGMFDRVAAGQLAAVLMVAAAGLIVAERRARGRARFTQTHGRALAAELPRLEGWRALAATSVCGLVLLIAFVLPTGVLVAWSLEAWAAGRVASTYPQLVTRSLGLSAVTAVVAVTAALVLAYGIRMAPTRLLRGAVRVAALGYAVPGSVVAVGVLLVLAGLDHAIEAAAGRIAGASPGLLLTGSAAGLVFAYLVRFVSVSFQAAESGLARVAPSMDEVARSLGAGPGRTLREVHLPLVSGALLTGLILVFVEVMKEMPATMLIRPFGMDTLAVEVWQRTTESLWQEAALPALTIVAAGVLPVVLLTRLRRR